MNKLNLLLTILLTSSCIYPMQVATITALKVAAVRVQQTKLTSPILAVCSKAPQDLLYKVDTLATEFTDYSLYSFPKIILDIPTEKEEELDLPIKTTEADLATDISLREDAIYQLQLCSKKLFDTDDTRSLAEHIDEICKHAQHLDPEIDTDYIETIKFLEKNKHKSGYWGILFWASQSSRFDFKKNIPVHPDILKYDKNETMRRLKFRLQQ